MIKSNSDHVLLVDKAAMKLNLNSLANSSGNLIIACKRNSLCTCLDNENHLNLLFNEDEYDKNCTEHQTKETKKCKLEKFASNEQDRDQSNTSNQQNQQSNQNNDDQAMNNQNQHQQNRQQQQQPPPQQPQQQNNNDQNNNENNEPNQLNQHHQIPNQLVDINNNIIEPELMIVDINNNLINLPDANFFDLNNNNYLWNNRNIDQPQNDDNQNNNSNEQQQQQQNQENSNQQQNNEHTSQSNNLTILKDKLNCNHILQKSTCTNLQSVQLRQRKKLLELDLNKPRTSNQYYSPMNEEENIIKEECCTSSTTNSTTNLYLFKRSSSSGRRKKSIHCKKCLAKHLTKCDHNSRCEHNNKCEHHHSIDCQTPETELKNELKKNFKKATTPLSLFPITTEINEQLIDNNNDNIENEIKQSNNVSTNNIKEQISNISTNASLISQQCPICLFNLNEPCKPNNCETHSFCKVCLIEWAKVSNECPLCRKCFTAVLNKNGKQMECFINLQNERDLNFEYSALENILNLDDLNWPFIASAFLNTNSAQSTNGQDNLIEQQCEQINNILNSMFGHLEPQNNMDIQWPF